MRISYTLVTDGSRDLSLLQYIIRWVIRRMPEPNLQLHPQAADFRGYRNPPDTFPKRLQEAVKRFPCDVLFVHRDAERQSRQSRVKEIMNAVREAGIVEKNVPVVPVRMTEAWLLTSESAIRRAAGNPHGTEPLDIPSLARLEDIPDPKIRLHSLLATASEKQGRRLKMFIRDINQHVHRVAVYTEDYSQLLRLPAFEAFQQDTILAIRRVVNS